MFKKGTIYQTTVCGCQVLGVVLCNPSPKHGGILTASEVCYDTDRGFFFHVVDGLEVKECQWSVDENETPEGKPINVPLQPVSEV